jgi:RimJ/RimL family protein N-acetyltransferase
VMEHFPDVLGRAASDRFADRIEQHFAEYGFGLWALQRRDSGEFIGFTGLAWQRFPAAFTPAVEIGWRLQRRAWGRGLATEAARAAAHHGFEVIGLRDIVSMTARRNIRSQAVMRRLGMHTDPADDFEHPAVPPGHPLAAHVLYRLSAAQWRDGTA